MGLAADAVIEKTIAYWASLPAGTEVKVPHVYKFEVTKGGAVVKSFILDLKARKISDSGDSEATISVDDDDFGDIILRRKFTFLEAVMRRKLKVKKGSYLLGMKLGPFVTALQESLKMGLAADEVIAKTKAYWASLPAGTEVKVPHVFKFEITKGGAVVKSYILDLKARKIYDSGDSEATISVDDDDFGDVILRGKLTFSEAVQQGKLKVTEGDQSLGRLLGPLVTALQG